MIFDFFCRSATRSLLWFCKNAAFFSRLTQMAHARACGQADLGAGDALAPRKLKHIDKHSITHTWVQCERLLQSRMHILTQGTPGHRLAVVCTRADAITTKFTQETHLGCVHTCRCDHTKAGREASHDGTCTRTHTRTVQQRRRQWQHHARRHRALRVWLRVRSRVCADAPTSLLPTRTATPRQCSPLYRIWCDGGWETMAGHLEQHTPGFSKKSAKIGRAMVALVCACHVPEN